RGLLRQIAVEQVALEDVTALIPRARLVHDEGGPVRCDHSGAVDLVTDELPGRCEADFVQPPLRDAFSTPHGCPDLGAFLDQKDIRASARRVLRGRTSGRSAADDQHIDVSLHLHARIPSGLMRLWAESERGDRGLANGVQSPAHLTRSGLSGLVASWRMYDVRIDH